MEGVVTAVASVSQSFGAVEQEVITKVGVLERAAEVAGELQEAIETFVGWLDETDGLLDAQGKPAGDLEVLADQLDKHGVSGIRGDALVIVGWLRPACGFCMPALSFSFRFPTCVEMCAYCVLERKKESKKKLKTK